MKKGFTLIELLAVIIILAIIALIATPIILNVVEDARISAGKSEAQMIYSGINNYCASSMMEEQLNGKVDICADGVTTEEVSQMVNLGNAIVNKVTYSNGKVTELEVESNNHTFKLCGDGSFVMDEEECEGEVGYSCTSEDSLICKLYSQYKEDNTAGLVKDSTNENLYYYKGTNEEVSNNYLWYGGHHWRVIEFDTDADTLLLISQQPLTAIQPASAVWTTQEAYEASYINTWLNEYFYNSLDSSIQNSIVENTFNVGIYTDIDEITTSQKVGLLDEEQYTRAGGKDSYLDIKDIWWLGNRSSSSDVRYVSNGNLNDNSPEVAGGVRAVIKISDITITGGNGTLESNYEAGNKATNTSDIQVGEYINVPYSGSDNACGDDNKCTFRVVSKDSDSIKVVLNGLLPTTSAYGSYPTITTSHTIYTPLNTFANNISSEYRYTENKTFYIGDYTSSSTNYKDIQDETLSVNVGLPTVGEMFSGNDIDLGTSSTKTFVNVATIENPTVSSRYWTMNRDISVYVGAVLNSGYLSLSSITNAYGVRAVIYLKSGTSALTFTGGEGTAQLPYELQ